MAEGEGDGQMIERLQFHIDGARVDPVAQRDSPVIDPAGGLPGLEAVFEIRTLHFPERATA
jgi:hypothetical protein